MKIITCLLALIPFTLASLVDTTPEAVAFRTANSIFLPANIQGFLNHGNKWDYGSCLINIGMFEVLDTFTDNATQTKYIFGNVSTAMDLYYQQGREAYNVTHNITMPFDSAIGDHIGLYPVSYLMRYLYLQKTGGTPNPDDLIVAQTVATKYIFGFPIHNSEGTIARTGCWSGESGDCLWADDMFMGLTLVSRLSVYLKNQSYNDWASNNKVGFAKHMQDTTGIFFHGFNSNDSHASCCKWSRANGWAFMSHTEELLAYESFPSSNLSAQILKIYQAHAVGAKATQDPTNGLWHQVITNTSMWVETSTSAMFVWSLSTGIMHKWITDADYGTVVDKAWIGVANTVLDNGSVNGICEGCGIQTSEAGYANKSTAYSSSVPGLGSVLRAAAAYQQLLRWRGNY